MRPSLARPVFLDTTVLSNFASSNAIETLDDTLDSIAIVPAVREELEQGAAHGHEYLERALESIEADWTEVDVSREATKHQEIYERLDRGEAQAPGPSREAGRWPPTTSLPDGSRVRTP